MPQGSSCHPSFCRHRGGPWGERHLPVDEPVTTRGDWLPLGRDVCASQRICFSTCSPCCLRRVSYHVFPSSATADSTRRRGSRPANVSARQQPFRFPPLSVRKSTDSFLIWLQGARLKRHIQGELELGPYDETISNPKLGTEQSQDRRLEPLPRDNYEA